MPGSLPMIDPSSGNPASGVGAKIMGGQYDRNRTLFGTHSWLFLMPAAVKACSEGQILSIYADERVRNKKNEAVQNDRVIGSAKIVRVSPGFATAYGTKASDDIVPGDYVGQAMAQASRSDTPMEAAPADDFEKDLPQDNMAPSDTPAPESGSDDLELEL